ncbi:HMG-Y-related protein A-like [Canna indica]|uniref:HMG-Y-related protein A-like n=1 Tax=Canna indica TaxID=4628 RepID=A0AAQ3KZ16_9LILI|nr:HMG-Y-related protein A-like [Canna indica]
MVVASATPPPAGAGRIRQYPPYKEMIVRAVETLKEKRGSSSRSINKFIRDNYSDLPTRHAALLKRHLRRLKEQGVLHRVKNSYKLPVTAKAGTKDAAVSEAGEKRKPGRPPKEAAAAAAKPILSLAGVAAPAASEKRKPGRPSKQAAAAAAKPIPSLADPAGSEKRKPGRPPKIATDAAASAVAGGGGGTRKRGRPPKSNADSNASGSGAGMMITERNPQRPPHSGSEVARSSERKKRGRPAAAQFDGKQKPGPPPKESAMASQTIEKRKPGRPPQGSVAAAQSTVKRKPGRPPKTSFVTAESTKKEELGQSSKAPAPAGQSSERRKPGRPPKAATTGASPSAKRKPGRPPGSVISTLKLKEIVIKKRGRPKKMQGIPSLDNMAEVTETLVVVVKKRGRPPKKTVPETPLKERGVENGQGVV